MLVSENHAVRNYNQTKGSRTQVALTAWVKTGHKKDAPKGGLITPMSAHWRGIFLSLGGAIELHEEGNIPVGVILAVGTGAVLFFGMLLICCLTACAGRENKVKPCSPPSFSSPTACLHRVERS
jgi:hypothetical protein